MEQIPIHHSVRIVLLNQQNEVLLMKAEDPSTTEPDGSYYGPFWFLIGGEIEKDEDIRTAAYREIFEETGLDCTQVKLGPEIWFGDFFLILSGKKHHMKQRFLLAHTSSNRVHLNRLTDSEKKIVKSLKWFSLNKMEQSHEVIYPVGLCEYLAPIIEGSTPEQTVKIILDRRPPPNNSKFNNIKKFTNYLTSMHLGLKRKTVLLAEHNSKWKEAFAWIAKCIRAELGTKTEIEMQHIGSTSIEGMCAKPILDILIIFRDSQDQKVSIKPLTKLGFVHKADGIAKVTGCYPDPSKHYYSFYDTSKQLDFIHLHTYVSGHLDIQKLLGFRDLLRNSLEYRKAYTDLKRKMYEAGIKRKDYTNSKTRFIDKTIGPV
ncbi:MAG: GrpB family protein [Oligoflexales bacterium]